ncbi:hypothetical protein QFZ62_001245 [Clavibacter sp. B3I6]|jgi:hypothetical protein|uniref:hypothetical protein n=1 Tax=Clavibacter sp. B3I6 TaxID=3042268 RepID=UPI002786716B|nr:hypothetical protein [Clavibacter sp. B3I6]MDQ0743937.1 hypothetical protein [Clavibacter sp. B3I6]
MSRHVPLPRSLRLGSLALLATGGLLLGFGAVPASASTDSDVTIQTLKHYGIPWAQSVLLTTPGNANPWCVSLSREGAGSGIDRQQHVWMEATVRMSRGIRTIMSFDSPDCQTGTGLAGTHGTIDTVHYDRWTVYPNRPPKPND